MVTNALRFTALMAFVFAGAVLPSSARAQQAAGPGNPIPAVVPAANPALLGPQVAPVDFVRWAPPSPFGEAPPQDRIHTGPNVAMMAVGGAAVVVGLIVGGDGGLIISTTGAVIGLTGLWRYLR